MMTVMARLAVCSLALAALASAAPRQDRKITTQPGQLTALPQPGSAIGSWPSFRGTNASGVAESQHLPDQWSLETGQNVLWRIPIPGLGHSSPIVWGNRIFVTSAISSRDDAQFVPGAYGAGTPSDDRTRHRWVVYCIDKATGKTIWERVAFEGVPIEKRHIKSTYASATPATDGRIVVAWFGSQGVYAYNFDGTLRWKVDLGHLDLGAYDIQTLEWGTASSPIIWNDLVILQADTHQDDFLVALDASTGKIRWKTDRDELPSWGTPTVVQTDAGPQLVTNASTFVRGYDPLTGKELWRLGKSSQITAPTPIFADGLIVVASGRAPERPIFVVRPKARGDITLADGQTSSDDVAWSNGRGPYMPTPLAYDHVLYVLANSGILNAYEIATGKQVFEARLPQLGSGFSASPVAADGKIYISGEDGDIAVIAAGREFTQIAINQIGEPLMATPALSQGVMYVRTSMSLLAIGDAPAATAESERARRGLGDNRPKNFLSWTAGGNAAADRGNVTIGVAPGSAPAAFAGEWKGDAVGMPFPLQFNVRVSGTSVTGELIGGPSPLKVAGGSISDTQIVLAVDVGGGRSVTFTGELKGGEMSFTRTMPAAGGSLGDAGFLGSRPLAAFVARRAK